MLNQSQRVIEILKTKYPIVQAPMNWVTNAQLVAAVSNAGGLGVLGPNAGQKQGYEPEVVYLKMKEEIKKVKEQTDKNFGINILLPINPYSEALLNAAIEEGVQTFVTVGPADKRVFEKIKAVNGLIIHRPLNPTSSNMKEAQNLGADILVATGYDEGGIIPDRAIGTFSVLPAMVDAVDIPVLAAGGINDKRGVNASFALGASGVFVGTRFLMTKESPLHEDVKERILTAKNEDVKLVEKNQRSLDTDLANELAEKYEEGRSTEENLKQIRENGGIRGGMLEGDLLHGIVSVNTGIEIIKDIPTVKELIHDLLIDINNNTMI